MIFACSAVLKFLRSVMRPIAFKAYIIVFEVPYNKLLLIPHLLGNGCVILTLASISSFKLDMTINWSSPAVISFLLAKSTRTISEIADLWVSTVAVNLVF